MFFRVFGSSEFEDQRWDPYNDICAVKTFQRTNNAVKKDNDRFFGYDQKTSTRFDRNFSISDFLKINVGTEIGLPLVSSFLCFSLPVEEVDFGAQKCSLGCVLGGDGMMQDLLAAVTAVLWCCGFVVCIVR